MALKPYSWRQAIMKSALPSTTRLVLFGISFHVTDAGEAACVSTAQLSSETGLSERAVISHVKAVDGEWLAIRRHGFGDQRWARNEYLPRLPGDPSLDVKGTERPSVPPAQIIDEGTERPSAPSLPKGTERDDTKALNVVQGDNGFVLSITPCSPPTADLLGNPEVDLRNWFEDSFWPAYPKQVAKARAWRAIRRLAPSAAVRTAIVRSVAAMRTRIERDHTDPKYIPHPTTWLNDQRWTDRDVPRETSARDERRCYACTADAVGVTNGKPHCRKHNPIFQCEGARP